MVDMVKVDSSLIESVGYDPDKMELTINFRLGKAYIYPAITQATFDSMLNAESIGRFFHAHIRKLSGARRIEP